MTATQIVDGEAARLVARQSDGRSRIFARASGAAARADAAAPFNQISAGLS
ncbi:hypothetical protein X769_18285 [Mesorhizobium sp. LSJC268A00]|nr:hypothetical protein X769_18285 [Mesorhizobium sp. LSJC268A00]